MVCLSGASVGWSRAASLHYSQHHAHDAVPDCDSAAILIGGVRAARAQRSCSLTLTVFCRQQKTQRQLDELFMGPKYDCTRTNLLVRFAAIQR